MDRRSCTQRGNVQCHFYPERDSLTSSFDNIFFFSKDSQQLDLPRPMEVDPQLSSIDSSHLTSMTLNFGSLAHSEFGDLDALTGLPSSRDSVQGPGVIPQNFLTQWYENNDGPWIPPRSLLDVSDEQAIPNQTSMREPGSFDAYRQNDASDIESVRYQDSGYGTRQSVGNASMLSGEYPDRDQECDSITDRIESLQPFPGTDDLESLEDRTNESCPQSSFSNNSSKLFCHFCKKEVRTPSEKKKHDLRHSKPFKCQIASCSRIEGFSTINDLDRHTGSLHPEALKNDASAKCFKCFVPGCKSKDKTWPRLDNFRSHLKRVHKASLRTEKQVDDMIQKAEAWNRSRCNMAWKTTAKNNYSRGMNMNPNLGSGDSFQNQQPMSKSQSLDSSEPFCQTSTSKFDCEFTVNPLDVLMQPSPILGPGRMDASKFRISKKWIKDHKKARRTDVSPQRQAAETLSVDSSRSAHTSYEDVLRDLKKISPARSASSDSSLRIDLDEALGEDAAITTDPQLLLGTLKAIEELGYVIFKNPQQFRLNPGTKASRKSEKTILCSTCHNFRGRPCEVKKHMQRHEKLWGCTFPACKNRLFGSKNDWKRHENSKHYHLETWRCNVAPSPGSSCMSPTLSDGDCDDLAQCMKTCFRRQGFIDHLKTAHQISSSSEAEKKCEECKMGRNCQAQFYCGFCVKLVRLEKKGVEAWTERFDHIDNHFLGRLKGGLPQRVMRRGIEHWIHPNKSLLRKWAGVEEGRFVQDEEAEGVTTDDNGAELIRTIPRSEKRGRSEENASDRRKRAKHGESAEMTYCCACNTVELTIFDAYCSACNHDFCDSCSREQLPPALG